LVDQYTVYSIQPTHAYEKAVTIFPVAIPTPSTIDNKKTVKFD